MTDQETELEDLRSELTNLRPHVEPFVRPFKYQELRKQNGGFFEWVWKEVPVRVHLQQFGEPLLEERALEIGSRIKRVKELIRTGEKERVEEETVQKVSSGYRMKIRRNGDE